MCFLNKLIAFDFVLCLEINRLRTKELRTKESNKHDKKITLIPPAVSVRGKRIRSKKNNKYISKMIKCLYCSMKYFFYLSLGFKERSH